MNLDNFKDDLLAKLAEQKIDIDKVQISGIEKFQNQITSNDLNVDDVINGWETIGAPTWESINGSIYSNSPQSDIDFSDNPGVKWDETKPKSGWGTGLINPNGYDSENIKIDFTMISGGHLNEGVCFNVTKNDDGSLNGYFVTICNHMNNESRLWRFDHYTLDQSFCSGINRNMWCHPLSQPQKRDQSSWEVGHTSTYGQDSFTCLASWTTGASNIPYSIEYKDGQITITVNNTVVANVTDSTYKKGSYGFWGNNCESGDLMYLSDLSIITSGQRIKTLDEVLREPSWRENSIRVLLNIGNNESIPLIKPDNMGEFINKMIDDKINFVGWDTEENKEQIEKIISLNNNNGKFINNTDYSTSMEKTSKYIKSLIPTISGTTYLILEDNNVLTCDDPSLMKNTANENYPNGKWKVIHDSKYYENDLGQLEVSGRYLSDMITSLDKTGKFEITYEDNSTDPNIIYVHRRPIAEIGLDRDGKNIYLTSLGYDLDHQSEDNKGIVEEEWKWRTLEDDTWHFGKLTNISQYNDYLIQLRVKDKDGAWSIPVSKYITKSADTWPIASFELGSDVISIHDTIEVKDNSYDPFGREIISREWTILKDNTEIYKGSTLKDNFMEYGTGKYKISLKVTNSDGFESEYFSKNIEILPDEKDPGTITNPIECILTVKEKDRIINWEIIDNENTFDRIILPDGTTSKDSKGEYIPTKSGKYQFTVYDKEGNEKVFSIEVSIDDKKDIDPTISSGTIPKTGISNIFFLIIFITIFLIMVFSYIKYIRLKCVKKF